MKRRFFFMLWAASLVVVVLLNMTGNHWCQFAGLLICVVFTIAATVVRLEPWKSNKGKSAGSPLTLGQAAEICGFNVDLGECRKATRRRTRSKR